jgi:hypothetical protein
MGNQSAHQSPLWFDEWLRKNRPEDYKYLNEKRKEQPRPYSVEDYLGIEEELKQQL